MRYRQNTTRPFVTQKAIDPVPIAKAAGVVVRIAVTLWVLGQIIRGRAKPDRDNLTSDK